MNSRFLPTVLKAIKTRGKENENLLTPFAIFHVQIVIPLLPRLARRQFGQTFRLAAELTRCKTGDNGGKCQSRRPAPSRQRR
jgi:hypothetical protein